MTLKIRLANMPFAGLTRPSIGLTQLKAVTETRFGDRVSIEIDYLNHVFGHLFGEEAYSLVSSSMAGHVTGLGEWIFRTAAFPEAPDNRAAYFTRFGHQIGRENVALIERMIEPVRARLGEVLDDIIERQGLDEADVVGITSMFTQNVPSIALARRLRARNPDQVLIMGGANCEDVMGLEWARRVPDLDFVFSGHSLVSFPAFVENLLKGDREACHRLPGVYSARNAAYFKGDDALHYEGPDPAGGAGFASVVWHAEELDLDAAVDLDYDDYFASLDRVLANCSVAPDLPFETSRGCWWGAKAHCTFCGLNGNGMAYRAMSPQVARGYIAKVVNRYADRASRFGCVDNIMPKEYFEQVFRDFRPPPHVELFYEVKSDITEAQVAILRDSGVRIIQPGVESFATSTLKHMRKGTTAFTNARLLLNCRKYGVTPSWNLLVGFPGEEASVYERYLEFLPDLVHLPPPDGIFPVRFDRFSPYFMKEKEYGLQLQPYEYYGYCVPWPEAGIRNVAYYFQDGNFEAPYIDDLAMWFSDMAEVVGRWQQAWADEEGKPPPQLELTRQDAGLAVLDSRGGAPRLVPLTPAEYDVLRACLEPAEESFLRAKFGDAVDTVRAKRLIFTERGRIMNIVMNLEAAEMAAEPIAAHREMVAV